MKKMADGMCMMVSEGFPNRADPNDLALELAEKSAAFLSSLPDSTAPALADLVRAMNCSYSNLIEGHNTHPIDIERALDGDYSADPKKRDLQLEAKAHIEVQKWIDEGGLKVSPIAPQAIIKIHKRFCDLMPEDLLWVKYPTTGERKKLFREKYGIATSRLGVISRSVRELCPAFWTGCIKDTETRGALNPFLLRLLRIIDYFGFTQFWMAMAVSRA